MCVTVCVYYKMLASYKFDLLSLVESKVKKKSCVKISRKLGSASQVKNLVSLQCIIKKVEDSNENRNLCNCDLEGHNQNFQMSKKSHEATS